MAIDSRLLAAMLPIAAATLSQRRDSVAENVVELPVAVIEYVQSMPEGRWYDRGVLVNVIRASVPDGPPAVLLAVQAWLLRFAWTNLSGWLGQDQAGWFQPDWSKRKASRPDDELAAQQLLGMDARTLHHWWVGAHELWINRWREAGTRDPQVLERAGLHAAELRMLEQ